MCTDTILNAHSHALLSLLMQQELLLLSITMQLSCKPTSLSASGCESAQLVVDYAIDSHAAPPWVTGITMGDVLLMLSDHCLLTLSLVLPAPPATLVSALSTLHAH